MPGSSSLPYRILLVGNYRLDRQMSMLRYHDWLAGELAARGVTVSSLEPGAVVGTIPAGPLTKWLRYVDKYLIFPWKMRARIRREMEDAAVAGVRLIVHITDHSNAVYAPLVPPGNCLATCHDLLAVRGALGEDTDCPASGFGKMLQHRILAGLGRCARVVCVSAATETDLRRLLPQVPSEVIPLALNQPYAQLPLETARQRLREFCPELDGQRFVLHVGSSLRRKNREGIIRSFARIADQWPGRLVFAGERLPPDLQNLADDLGIGRCITELETPPAPVIEALYNLAHCLFFPSKTEGFGWPVIEAQACGCPVLVARTTSLPEVGGDAVLIREFGDEAGFAEDILRLDDPALREAMIGRGLINLRRFATSAVMDRYADVYARLARSQK